MDPEFIGEASGSHADIQQPNQQRRYKPMGNGVGNPFLSSYRYCPAADPEQITRCLNAISASDDRSSGEILPLVYDELRRHASRRMGMERSDHTLQATSLVHEAWMRLTKKGDKGYRWENRAHFFGAAACAMRRILVESARRKAASKRGGGLYRVDIDKVDLMEAQPEEKLLMIEEALNRMQESDPLRAQVVTLRFFGGYTQSQVAAMMGVCERTVERHWSYAKAWLFDYIRQNH
jgi:RNA polymerase sigma factor (TIGR02999 family)